ncbi:MAG TPA: hypothetical protein VG890_00555 [Puia sp.]|nr:hypothetical protein [Puia sp.]
MSALRRKIVWFLVGNPDNTASSRIHGIRVHEKLRELGYHSVLAYRPAGVEEVVPFNQKDIDDLEKVFQRGDIAIFQKIKSEANFALFEVLRRLGVKLVLIDCDLPLSEKAAELMDLVICTSSLLADLYAQKGATSIYIEDSPESFFLPRDAKSAEKLLCYWFGEGSGGKWKDVEILKDIIKNEKRLERWELVTISNHPDADIKWHSGFLRNLLDADVVVVPVFQESEAWQVKSANRILQAMALSLPVLCSPIPSYRNIIKQNKNGIICYSKEDWVNALIGMEQASNRACLGANAFATAQSYNLDINIDRWINNLQLDDHFKVSGSLKEVKENKKIQRYFFGKLLQRNIGYWNAAPFTLLNIWAYFKARTHNLIKRV